MTVLVSSQPNGKALCTMVEASEPSSAPRLFPRSSPAQTWLYRVPFPEVPWDRRKLQMHDTLFLLLNHTLWRNHHANRAAAGAPAKRSNVTVGKMIFFIETPVLFGTE